MELLNRIILQCARPGLAVFRFGKDEVNNSTANVDFHDFPKDEHLPERWIMPT